VLKDTSVNHISEEVRVQFRAEFCNIFNHPNFVPNSTLYLRPRLAQHSNAVRHTGTNSQCFRHR
jgi:hypothetical protein